MPFRSLGTSMKRREFITLVAGATAAWSLRARAQQAGRSYRLGFLVPVARGEPAVVAFLDELRVHAFVESQNLIVDARGFAARSEQFPDLALAFAKSNIDALVCGGGVALHSAGRGTQKETLLCFTHAIV